MNRRHFLALIGASAPGVWLNGVGLIQLPKKMVIIISGRCSFCGKEARDVFGLAGVISRPTRICNECIDICFEIMLGDVQMVLCAVEPSEQTEEAESAISIDFEQGEVIPDIKVPQSRAEMKSLIDQLHRLLDQSEANQEPRERSDELSCSFCDLGQSKVKKLIAGPQSHICDLCVGDAAALLSMHC
jgi:ATP-dependent protease Clp ATPase subunit